MYIRYKLSKFIYDFVQAEICTCTKVYYSLIQKCTADIGHRTIGLNGFNFTRMKYKLFDKIFLQKYSAVQGKSHQKRNTLPTP